MSTRINAHHIICPGCMEKVFVDELVGGHCPLCGCVMEGEEEGQDFDEVVDRSDLAWIVFHYFVFRKFDAMGVSPVQILQLISRLEEQCQSSYPPLQNMEFRLEVPLRWWERILPKRCAECGRRFVRSGKKTIAGSLNQADFSTEFHCPEC